MSRVQLALAALAALVFSTGSVRAEDAVTLAYKYPEGQPRIYRSETKIEQSQTINGMEFKNLIENSDVVVRSLEKVTEEGNFQVKTENKRLKAKLNLGPAGEYAFDSTTRERDKGGVLSPTLNAVYERLDGAAYSFTMTPRGEVTEAKGYEELLADVLKDNPLAAQFTGGGTNKAAKLGMDEQFAYLPEKPVKAGDTWDRAYEIELPKIGTLKGKRTFTLEGVDKIGERATVRIRVSNSLTADLALDVAGNKITGSMSIDESSGTIQFDPAAGELVSMDTTHTMTGSLKTNVNGQEITVDLNQKQTVKVEQLAKLPE